MYPFGRYDRRWFLNDWVIENKLIQLNSPAVRRQLDDKLYFRLLLRQLGLEQHMAPAVGLLFDGAFTSFSRAATLREALLQHGRVVAKPVSGLGGAGVELLESEANAPANGLYVLEGALKQHRYAAEIFPGSVNTIRLFTLRNRPDEAPFIAGAAHRFGVKASAPVDNLSRGGIASLVDPETGVLSAAHSVPGCYSINVHPRHPDTGATIQGVSVAMWSEVKALGLALANRIPGLAMAGWDICVTPEGPRLIEGNGSVPNPELFQMHWPILRNPKTRQYFASRGMVSPRLVRELDELAASEADPALR